MVRKVPCITFPSGNDVRVRVMVRVRVRVMVRVGVRVRVKHWV